MAGWAVGETAALLATGLSVLAMGLLGARLLARFLRTGAPTGFLGIALLFGAAPAEGLVSWASLAGSPPSRGAWQLAYAGMIVCGGVAGVSVLRFAHELFRPGSRVLSWIGTAAAAYFGALACTVPFADGIPREHLATHGMFAILFAIFGWTALESFRWWLRYRRAPGLEPRVVDGLRLWGLAALAVVGEVACLELARGRPAGVAVAQGLGLLACAALWRAFPAPAPAPRRRRARRGEAPEPPEEPGGP